MNGNAMHPCGCACGVCMGMSLEDAVARQGGEDSGDELVIDRLRAEVRRLEAENAALKNPPQTQEREPGAAGPEWSDVIHRGWCMGEFYGPCVHGRDPYTRCDEDDAEDPCNTLTPREAFARKVAEEAKTDLREALEKAVAALDKMMTEKAESLAQVEVLAAQYQVACRERDALAEMLREVCALI